MNPLLLALILTPLTLADPPPLAKGGKPPSTGTALYLACGAADLASTYAALNTGRFKEGNPLMGGGTPEQVVLKGLAVKGIVYGALRWGKAPPWVFKTLGVAQCGAAGWNTWQVLK